MKRRLLLRRKVMTNLESILKSRDITLPTKVHLRQGYGFSCRHVWMWVLDCEEGWAPKNWCFWTVVWYWRRLLRVPWTARRSNQPILKEISLGCSLVGLMLKLKLQYFGHLTWRADSFEKTLMLGKKKAGRERDDREWGGWMASPTQWTWVWVDSGSWWWTGRPGMLWFIGLQRIGHDWVTELNWTEPCTCGSCHLSHQICRHQVIHTSSLLCA